MEKIGAMEKLNKISYDCAIINDIRFTELKNNGLINQVPGTILGMNKVTTDKTMKELKNSSSQGIMWV